MAHADSRENRIPRGARKRPRAERAAALDGARAGDNSVRPRPEAQFAERDPFAAPTAQEAQAGEPTRAAGLAESPDEAVGQTLGRYKLLEKVGEGGWGVVYVAEQTEPVRRRVALKVIKLGMDTKAVVARFEAERQALAMMDHANIAKVLDAGSTGRGRPYFVMELVRGVKITDYCDQGRLSTKDRLDLFIQICQAIQHAHQKGIIHRDIKPSNILVTLQDGAPVPKVIDFGIAKATTERLTEATVYTQLHQVIGTPAYMSPEQAEMSGLDIDTRSDIYSLGVLLYELLTGRTPFDARDLVSQGIDAMRETIREKEPARPSARVATLQGEDLATTARRRSVPTPKLRHQLEGDLDCIVMKCLEKDRVRRYATANGLAADLKRHLNHEPVVARPPSKLYEFRKTVRRHRVGFAATAAVIIALALGLSFSTWQFVEKNRAYNLTVAAREQEARQRRRAEVVSEESRGRAVRLNVAYGVRLMEAGDLLSGLQWFIEALRLDEGDPVRAGIHRVRLAAVLRDCPKLVQFWRFGSTVQHVEFSPDGQRILTAHEDGTVQLWDPRSGQRTGPPLRHPQSVNWAAFSPDSRRLVTTGGDGTVRLWDAASGQPAAPPIAHPGHVVRAVISPDGRRLLVGGDDGTARIWDPVSGQPLTAPMRHAEGVGDLGFSPDGRRVVTASEDGTARVWDAATGAAVAPPLRHGAAVVRASFSPDGRRVLTASHDGTARIWDASTGEQLTPPLRHTTWLTDARFNPDNSTVATASFDNTARIWDVETGKPVCSPLRHGHSVMSSAFSPDGRRLVTACFNQTAQVWDAATGERLLSPLKHSGYVSDALFSPDGRTILTCGYDGTMRLWAMANRGSLLAPLDVGGAVSQVTFSPDGRLLAAADTNGVIHFWSSETGQPLPAPVPHTAAVRQLAFSPNGRQLLLARPNGMAQVFDVASGQPAGIPMRLGQPIDVAGFSSDGRRVFLGANQGLARVWDASSGQPISPLSQFTNSNRLVAFDRDATRVVAVDGQQFARVWDLFSGRPLSPPVGHPSDVVCAEFSPDGRRVLTSCSDSSLAKLSAHVWDAATGMALVPALQHQDGVLHAAFSPDGHSVVTASEDGTAGIWDAETGRLRTPFLRHDYQVFYATFSPDGRFVATASRDRTARVWDARTGEPVTPPLRHAAPVEFAAFSAKGDRLTTRSRDGRALLWDLAPEHREAAELVRLGRLLNSRQIDSSGGALPVDAATLEALWREHRSGSAEAMDTPVETTAAWHEEEASECEASRRWFAAVFHLRRLLELDPLNPGLAARLAAAQGALDEEKRGQADRLISPKRQQAGKS